MNRMAESDITEHHLNIKKYKFGDEELIVPALGVYAYKHTLAFMNGMSKYKDKFKDKTPTSEDMLEIIATDSIILNAVSNMTDLTLDKMFPNKDDSFKDTFAIEHMMTLMSAVIESNMPKNLKQEIEKTSRIQARIQKHDESTTKDKVAEA